MFRSRSNSNDNGSQRQGKGESKSKSGQQKSAKQARRKVDPRRAEQRAFDPRSGETGKKVRRIESGPVTGRPADPTEIGGPPAHPVPGGLANRGPSLPPLKQPTGDVPRIPAEATEATASSGATTPPDDRYEATGASDRAGDRAADQTVAVQNSSAGGVFGENRPPSADVDAAPGRPLRAVGEGADISDPGDGDPVGKTVGFRAEERLVGDAPSAMDEEIDAVQADLRDASAARFDESGSQRIPSALPDFDDLTVDSVSANTSDHAGEQRRAEHGRDGGLAPVATAVAGAGAVMAAGRDPFGAGDQGQSPAYAAASRGSQTPPIDPTRAMPSELSGSAGFDTGPGGDGSSGRPDSGRAGNPQRRERPQDTEFKLSDNRQRQKPKEPNRLLLFLAIGAVLLAGAAAAWYLTQRDDGSADVASSADDPSTEATADETTDTVAPEAPVTAEEPVVTEPTLFFDAATSGPLQQGETYSIDLVGEPEGSMLQVVVDDIPQGNPDPLLPDLILPSGRHTLYIQITNGAEITQSTPIELFVLGDPPPQGYRANLSSVDMVNEGWPEAIRQYDEYRAAGHEALDLLPLSPGYWNLYVGGLGEDRAAAQGYCESFGLAVPDECFPTYYESAAGTTDSDSTTESTDAMDDEDATSTTAAGG